MSDHDSPHTPEEIPTTCPSCYPDIDPESYVIAWCQAHSPECRGTDDDLSVHRGLFLTSSMEAGGHGNQDMCEQIHQRKP